MEVEGPEHGIHSWRDFFVHMGTVFLGLILALGLEQVVIAVHESHQRAELREALDADSHQAIIDAKRSEAASEQQIAWSLDRADQVRAALATNTPLGPRAVLNPLDYDLIGNSAFKAAKASGLLALLPQHEVRAYSEEDGLMTLASQTFDQANVSRQNLRAFELEFKAGNGMFDFSKATPEELHRYLDLLMDSALTMNIFRFWNTQDRGLETALLRGERDLPALQKAERQFTKSIARLKS
jgi:hypothetical protein